MNELTTTILTTLLGIIATYVATRHQTLGEVQSKFDFALLEERVRTYKDLWSRLEPLAKYARPARLDADNLRTLSANLRTWYLQVGGPFLTDPSRDAYFDLQDGIIAMLKNISKDRTLLSDENYESKVFTPLQKLGSSLRTSLRTDLRSRMQSRRAKPDTATNSQKTDALSP